MENNNLKQPKALYLLFFVQMWESFSYYGMRAILVLYMISELKLSDSQAFGIYAVSTALTEFFAIIGGRLGDKVFGLKYAINLGGLIIICGHIVLALPYGENALYLSLALISIGACLLKTNCTALLGEFYKDEDPRRDAGYTLFYVGINIGAFIATILCALIAENYGYHYGFLLAAIGMMIGLIGLFKFTHILEDKGNKPIESDNSKQRLYTGIVLALIPIVTGIIYFHEVSIYLVMIGIFGMLATVLYHSQSLPKKERENVRSILLTIMLLAIFFGFEEQIGSTLVVFAERYSDKLFLGMSIPAASLTTMNPLTILIMGPIVALILKFYESRARKSVNIYISIAIAFAIQGLAFYVLSIFTKHSVLVSANVIGFSFGMIAFSELFIGPIVYSNCAKLSPNNMRGLLMGTVMVGFSIASIFSGFISKYMAIDESNKSNEIMVYYDGFIKIVIVCVLASVIIALTAILFKRKNK